MKAIDTLKPGDTVIVAGLETYEVKQNLGGILKLVNIEERTVPHNEARRLGIQLVSKIGETASTEVVY